MIRIIEIKKNENDIDMFLKAENISEENFYNFQSYISEHYRKELICRLPDGINYRLIPYIYGKGGIVKHPKFTAETFCLNFTDGLKIHKKFSKISLQNYKEVVILKTLINRFNIFWMLNKKSLTSKKQYDIT